MSREYILNRYKLAMQDFQLARNEDEQWTARKEMARLERLASELYGFDYDMIRSTDGLTNELETMLRNAKIKYQRGVHWTTDVGYRKYRTEKHNG